MPTDATPPSASGSPGPERARDSDRDRAPAERSSVAEHDPDAPGEMGAMFDEVSDRYDLLNTLMSLGRDRAWRGAMWNEVPESARVVLDLATGNGASLTGLRRPGRLVIGLDLSPLMLHEAALAHGRIGWAPRLVCGDAFSLPLRDGAVDAVTIAFGVRNFRPREAAMRELARVLKPGGVLVVLEATAPRRGPFAPLHRFYIRRVIPWAGRISSHPEAYLYLSRSILDFGAGPEFEAAMKGAGLTLDRRRAFMLGAVRLWVARRPAAAGAPLQSARLGNVARGEMRRVEAPAASEWRWWNGVQLAISISLLATLSWATWKFATEGDRLPLEPWQRSGMWLTLILGIAGFAVRTLILLLRISSPPPPR